MIGRESTTDVAVETENLIARGEFVFDEPGIERPARSTSSPPMCRPIIFDVVDGEETDVGFSAALADFSIGFHCFEFPRLSMPQILGSIPSVLASVLSRYFGLVLFSPEKHLFLCPALIFPFTSIGALVRFSGFHIFERHDPNRLTWGSLFCNQEVKRPAWKPGGLMDV